MAGPDKIKFKLFWRVLPALAVAAALGVLPARTFASAIYPQLSASVVHEGDNFIATWYLDTQLNSVNALNLSIGYSADTLEAVEASPGNSLVSLWVEQPKITQPGKIELIGGIPSGAEGSKLPVFQAVFQAKAAGPAFIRLENNSTILLNDGKGTPDQLAFSTLNFSILPSPVNAVKISSPTQPDQNKWYSLNQAVIKFAPLPGQKYSYVFTPDLNVEPDNQPENAAPQITYPNLSDGIYYFKLNSQGVDGKWQPAGTFRVQVDTTAPEAFMPLVARGKSIFNNGQFLSFSAIDKLSGVAGYQVKLGLFGWFMNADSPYRLHRPLVGNQIAVRAIDRAGNVRTAYVAYAGYLSESEFYCLLVLFVLCFLVLLWYWKRGKKHRRHQHQNRL